MQYRPKPLKATSAFSRLVSEGHVTEPDCAGRGFEAIRRRGFFVGELNAEAMERHKDAPHLQKICNLSVSGGTSGGIENLKEIHGRDGSIGVIITTILFSLL